MGRGLLPVFGHEKIKQFHHQGGWVLRGYVCKLGGRGGGGGGVDLTGQQWPGWAPCRDAAPLLEAGLKSMSLGTWLIGGAPQIVFSAHPTQLVPLNSDSDAQGAVSSLWPTCSGAVQLWGCLTC